MGWGTRGLMKYLLDTHVFLWLLGTPYKLGERVRGELKDPGVTLFVSAASAFEIALKTRLGKLPGESIVRNWDKALSDISALPLSISPELALHAGGMQWGHRDPFDRLLVAQAVGEEITLVTADHVILRLRDDKSREYGTAIRSALV